MAYTAPVPFIVKGIKTIKKAGRERETGRQNDITFQQNSATSEEERWNCQAANRRMMAKPMKNAFCHEKQELTENKYSIPSWNLFKTPLIASVYLWGKFH